MPSIELQEALRKKGFEEAQRLMLAALQEKHDELLKKFGAHLMTLPIIVTPEKGISPPPETPEREAAVRETRAALGAVQTMIGIVGLLGRKTDDGKRWSWFTPEPLRHIESLAVHAWLMGFQAGKDIGCEAERQNPCGDYATFEKIRDAKPPAKVEILRALNLVTQVPKDPLG